MADVKITDLTALASPAAGDLLELVDVSDATDSAQGSSRKVTLANVLALAAPTAAQVAALVEATTPTAAADLDATDRAAVTVDAALGSVTLDVLLDALLRLAVGGKIIIRDGRLVLGAGFAESVFSTDAAGSSPEAGFVSGAGFRVRSGYGYAWSASGAIPGAADTDVRRAAAGVVSITDGAGGGGILELAQVAAGGTPGANCGRVFSKDVSGTAEVFVRDEAGNETQISAHATDSPGAAIDGDDPTPVVVRHSNDYTGRVEWLHLSALARAVESLTGERYLYAADLPGGRRDWSRDQDTKQAEYDAGRAAELAARDEWAARHEKVRGAEPAVRPVREVRKPMPDHLKPRGK